MLKNTSILFFFLLQSGFVIVQAQTVNNTPIQKDSPSIKAWASAAEVNRGWQNISDTSLGRTSIGDGQSVLGKAGEGAVLSLGDAGNVVLTFEMPIQSQIGPEIAVFENSFDGKFLEFAFVEVSSNGINFFRFPSHSLIQNHTQTGPFEYSSKDSVLNLAGMHPLFYGTTFEFDDLDEHVLLDKLNVQYVKVVDVVGSIDSIYGSRDALGNIINDPYPTAFENGGFDLDAVAVLHPNFTSGTNNQFTDEPYVYQNQILNLEKEADVYVYSMQSNLLTKLKADAHSIDISHLNLNGLYIIKVQKNDKLHTFKAWM